MFTDCRIDAEAGGPLATHPHCSAPIEGILKPVVQTTDDAMRPISIIAAVQGANLRKITFRMMAIFLYHLVKQ